MKLLNGAEIMENDALEIKIAAKIKALRLERDLSLNQLGKLCGISAQRVFELEAGKKIPRLNTLIKVADGLGISVFDIIYEPLCQIEKSDANLHVCENWKTCPGFKPAIK